jgi:hypothetical protein
VSAWGRAARREDGRRRLGVGDGAARGRRRAAQVGVGARRGGARWRRWRRVFGQPQRSPAGSPTRVDDLQKSLSAGEEEEEGRRGLIYPPFSPDRD